MPRHISWVAAALIGSLFSTSVLSAQPLDRGIPAPVTAELLELNIKSLCGVIDNQLPAEDGGPTRYVYQTRLMQAAELKPGDTPQVQIQKVQRFWNERGHKLSCNSASFDVRNGSLLKYAISNKFDTFVYDVSRKWKLDLNRIDCSDNRTALDYLFAELERANSSNNRAVASKLESYGRLMRAGGAMTREELAAKGLARPCIGASRP